MLVFKSFYNRHRINPRTITLFFLAKEFTKKPILTIIFINLTLKFEAVRLYE
jgi:hypothetical protein